MASSDVDRHFRHDGSALDRSDLSSNLIACADFHRLLLIPLCSVMFGTAGILSRNVGHVRSPCRRREETEGRTAILAETMSFRRRVIPFLLVAACLGAGDPDSSTISGTVVDASGGPVPGARVALV